MKYASYHMMSLFSPDSHQKMKHKYSATAVFDLNAEHVQSNIGLVLALYLRRILIESLPRLHICFGFILCRGFDQKLALETEL